MTSVLKVDNIQNSSGTQAINIHSSGLIIPSAGGTIQTQYTQYTGTFQQVFSANTDGTLNNLSVNITPTSTSSKILIQAHVTFEGSIYDHDFVWMFFRGSTALKAPVSGSRRSGISMGQTAYYADDRASTASSAVYQYFDEPNTTSQVTYHVGLNCRQAVNVYVNRTKTDTNSTDFERGISYISVTEIAG